MARMPRLVVPGYPHHAIQRGNRRMKKPGRGQELSKLSPEFLNQFFGVSPTYRGHHNEHNTH